LYKLVQYVNVLDICLELIITNYIKTYDPQTLYCPYDPGHMPQY